MSRSDPTLNKIVNLGTEVPQGGAAWRKARSGLVTASRLGDLTARTKTGWSASRASYMGQILAERLTGEPLQTAASGPMRWGLETEPLAKAAYAYRMDVEVEAAGFVLHPTVPMSGASPDGFLGEDGVIEIKCPTTITHLETLAADEIPSKHLAQMHWQMACTGRAWCDFVSFDPRLPEELKLFVRRAHQDEAFITELEGMVRTFLDEVDQRLLAILKGQRLELAA
jgi:putative phage-type endonuclease